MTMASIEAKLIDSCSLLYPNKCCRQIISELTLSKPCMATVLSKTMGYGIIMGSILVKMPQLVKILGAKSGEGISFAGVLLELVAMTFSAAYAFANRFPFSAWGETLFLMVVTAAIGYLVLKYERSQWSALAFVMAYSSVTYALMSGLTPLSVLWSMQAANLPLAISGKMLQVYTNYSIGHTGQLSAITAWLMFGGAFARIFTSIQETGDQLVIITFAAASLANFLIVAQIHYYWNKTNTYLESMTKKKLL